MLQQIANPFLEHLRQFLYKYDSLFRIFQALHTCLKNLDQARDYDQGFLNFIYKTLEVITKKYFST